MQVQPSSRRAHERLRRQAASRQSSGLISIAVPNQNSARNTADLHCGFSNGSILHHRSKVSKIAEQGPPLRLSCLWSQVIHEAQSSALHFHSSFLIYTKTQNWHVNLFPPLRSLNDLKVHLVLDCLRDPRICLRLPDMLHVRGRVVAHTVTHTRPS